MKVALSPCPNDTFLFFAWIHNLIPNAPPIEPHYADIEQLNTWACEGKFPLTKLSFAAYPEARKHYLLLPVGAALGFGCGPKLIAKHPLNTFSTVALPGTRTTAHLLFERFIPQPVIKKMVRYDQVVPLVRSGAVDAGVVIHESRLNHGCTELCDLGTLWEQTTHLPLPLGGLALHRDIADAFPFISALRHSLSYALTHRATTLPFLRTHSQELSHALLYAHLDTYITSDTHSLSPKALLALETLLSLPASDFLI